MDLLIQQGMDLLIHTASDGPAHTYSKRWTCSYIQQEMDLVIHTARDGPGHTYSKRWTWSYIHCAIPWSPPEHINTATFPQFCLFVGCLTSQQHAGVAQGRICSDNFTCCHTETEVGDQNFQTDPVTVCRHRANQSQHRRYNARRLAG